MKENGVKAFTLNPFTYNILRREGEEVNIKVEIAGCARVCARARGGGMYMG